MNGQEKSNSAIVAERPTNGAGRRPAEEPAEPRARAKGNGDPAKHGPESSAGSRARHKRWSAYGASVRFAGRHPRQEPDALIGLVRICAGGAQR